MHIHARVCLASQKAPRISHLHPFDPTTPPKPGPPPPVAVPVAGLPGGAPHLPRPEARLYGGQGACWGLRLLIVGCSFLCVFTGWFRYRGGRQQDSGWMPPLTPHTPHSTNNHLPCIQSGGAGHPPRALRRGPRPRPPAAGAQGTAGAGGGRREVFKRVLYSNDTRIHPARARRRTHLIPQSKHMQT